MSYINSRATADRLLKKYGQSVVITHIVEGAYDPEISSAPTTSSSEPGFGAVFDWGTDLRKSFGIEYDTNLIESQDKLLILSAVNINPPKLGDIVQIAGISYTFAPPLKLISPGGILVVIEANIRGCGAEDIPLIPIVNSTSQNLLLLHI